MRSPTFFDSLIVGDWPRGLYLAQQLSLQGEKTAYFYQRPVIKNPLGLFLTETSIKEKSFFNSLGVLEKQAGGFCLLSPKGVWPLQKKKEGALIKTQAPFSFNKNFLFYLSHNLAGKVFEFNDSVFHEQKLDLFCDYFIFYPDFKKIQFFKEQNPQIYFFEKPDWNIHSQSLKIPKKLDKNPLLLSSFIPNPNPPSLDSWLKEFSAHKIFFFKDQIPQTEPIYWQWQAFYYEVDFKDYKDIIPQHLVCIKNLMFPWCYDNLISLFHKNQRAEVWMKLRPDGDSLLWQKKAKQALEGFFPGVSFKPLNQAPVKSFCIYGEESLQSPAKKEPKEGTFAHLKDFFQGDLASEIKNESCYLENLHTYLENPHT